MRHILTIILILIASSVLPVTAFQESATLTHEEGYGPIVDYSPASSAERRMNNVGGRGSRYNSGRPLPPELQQNLYRNTIRCGGVAPPLVPWSDHIIIGQIVYAQAHLSTDLSNVYTTFTIQVEKTVKDRGASSVNPGDVIDADREGGRVRYPSGYILHFSVDGNGMPQMGKRYVFFLKWDEREHSYLLITGYGLEEGKVVRLDRIERNIAYEGPDEEVFMQKLEDEVRRGARPNNGMQRTRK